MTVYEIQSRGTVDGEGFSGGRRRIFSRRRSPEAVARRDTTAEERKHQVTVTCMYGRDKGKFWTGTIR